MSKKLWYPSKSDKSKKVKKCYTGHVYVLHIEGSDRYKIGMSTNIMRRITELRQVIPFKIVIIGVWYVDDARFEERSLHKKYESKRVIREWFSLSAHDCSEIKTYLDSIELSPFVKEVVNNMLM